ncbi:E3 SUMO-protein ligase ZBED1-like [Toxotes jaculatrix]|uniref:E3 SUMO-protein ligase ZBED1-like n=1 Tax=Toxotes jaculatrix TaxID=941984 RepID=UPI001B3A8CB9|nr:E3 SUMO-protein ligase ZBED1-like [Toxotes jaculatrix]
MVDRFLEQQPAVYAVLLSPQVRKGAHDICTLSEADVSGAEHLVKVLKPMKLATTTMSEESMPTFSVIAPLHAQVLADFTPAPEDGLMTCEIKHAIWEDLMKRYTSTKERDTLHIASALDPDFKALPFLSEDEKVETYSRMTTAAASLKVLRQEAQVPEEEGDDMAERHDDDEEDDVVEEVRDKGQKLEEAGPSTRSTTRPSSLTVLLSQTFSVVVTTVQPKSRGLHASGGPFTSSHR